MRRSWTQAGRVLLVFIIAMLVTGLVVVIAGEAGWWTGSHLSGGFHWL